MGWNLALVHATGPAASVEGFALTNGYRPDPGGHLVPFESFLFGGTEADGDWARPPLAIADVSAGTLIAGHLILSHDWAADLSRRRGTATWAVWQSTSTTYGVAHYRDGVLVRELQRSEHETLHEVGDPLPEEADLRWSRPDADPDDEDDLFTLVQRLTDLPDSSRWLDGPATIYRPVPITELEPPRKRRLFGR